MSDAGNNPWAMWLAEKHRADGLEEKLARLTLRIAALCVDYPGKGDPWADFLYHRARVLVMFRKDGKTDFDIASELSMDPVQVALILDAVERGEVKLK